MFMRFGKPLYMLSNFFGSKIGGECFLMREEERKKGKMTVAEAGRKGGERTAQTHGREFYEEIGRKGGEKVSQERGPEFYSEIGSKGGSERAKQHEGTLEARGKTSLEEAGHRGGQRVRRLIQAGKAQEAE
jgi:general stress protein YciG